MKKRFVSMLLTMVVLGGMARAMSVSSLAADVDYKENEAKVEVIALSEDISEATINEISNSVYAAVVYRDGTNVPIDSVVTIERLPTTVQLSTNSYAVTLSGKVDDDKANKSTSHTNATATLKLIWTDGPQLNNSIDEVSGTLNVVKGKVLSGKVRYGDGWRSAMLWTKKDVGASSSFSFFPQVKASDPSADYSITFEDENVVMYLKVSASVFQ